MAFKMNKWSAFTKPDDPAELARQVVADKANETMPHGTRSNEGVRTWKNFKHNPASIAFRETRKKRFQRLMDKFKSKKLYNPSSRKE